jgi:hypothetical protein
MAGGQVLHGEGLVLAFGESQRHDRHGGMSFPGGIVGDHRGTSTQLSM